eukprot:ctg_2058.g523
MGGNAAAERCFKMPPSMSVASLIRPFAFLAMRTDSSFMPKMRQPCTQNLEGSTPQVIVSSVSRVRHRSLFPAPPEPPRSGDCSTGTCSHQSPSGAPIATAPLAFVSTLSLLAVHCPPSHVFRRAASDGRLVYALDFDGVLCDSVDESSRSAYRAALLAFPERLKGPRWTGRRLDADADPPPAPSDAKAATTSSSEDAAAAGRSSSTETATRRVGQLPIASWLLQVQPPQWMLNAMRKLRPVIETGYENVLLVRLLAEEHMAAERSERGMRPLTVGEIAANWQSLLHDKLLRDWGLDATDVAEPARCTPVWPTPESEPGDRVRGDHKERAFRAVVAGARRRPTGAHPARAHLRLGPAHEQDRCVERDTATGGGAARGGCRERAPSYRAFRGGSRGNARVGVAVAARRTHTVLHGDVGISRRVTTGARRAASVYSSAGLAHFHHETAVRTAR